MEKIIDFFVSVIAGISSYYICIFCKWLHDKGRKK